MSLAALILGPGHHPQFSLIGLGLDHIVWTTMPGLALHVVYRPHRLQHHLEIVLPLATWVAIIRLLDRQVYLLTPLPAIDPKVCLNPLVPDTAHTTLLRQDATHPGRLLATGILPVDYPTLNLNFKTDSRPTRRGLATLSTLDHATTILIVSSATIFHPAQVMITRHVTVGNQVRHDTRTACALGLAGPPRLRGFVR